MTAALPGTATGRVTLVGAGPGDPDLLTVKALAAMRAADIVLYDELVSDEILALIRPPTRRLHVGKRGFRGGRAQSEINRLMVRFAQAGDHVVRLKSGDPMVFGRGGEEIDCLQAAGIEVQVVPGITAALALAAATTTSLSHRHCAQSVQFVTGHTTDGVAALSELDGDVRTTTLVVYMGARQALALTTELLASGRCATTPAVAVADLSRRSQRCWCGTLAALPLGIQSLPAGAPILIGIGKVFADADRRMAHPLELSRWVRARTV